MCVCVLLGTHHVSCLHVSCLFGGVSLQRCGGFSIVVLPLTPLSTRWLTNIILFRFQVVTPVGRCSTTHNSQPDMVSKRRLQGLEKQIRSKFHPCETNRKSHEHKRKLHSPANMKSESRRLRATHFADGCEHVWPGAKQSMPLDPGIFKSTPRLKVLKRDHRRGILGSILCPFGIRPDWQCVTSYISGAARSVSRDIPFVSAPFAQEKDAAVPALQQQHATAVFWCRCHSTKSEGTTRATFVHHQQPHRQQQQQEEEEKASKCKNSRKWTPSTQNSHVRLTFR